MTRVCASTVIFNDYFSMCSSVDENGQTLRYKPNARWQCVVPHRRLGYDLGQPLLMKNRVGSGKAASIATTAMGF